MANKFDLTTVEANFPVVSYTQLFRFSVLAAAKSGIRYCASLHLRYTRM